MKTCFNCKYCLKDDAYFCDNNAVKAEVSNRTILSKLGFDMTKNTNDRIYIENFDWANNCPGYK